jgi:UDP-N-acetyl-2-amino-2-deoxyglucuronate dehydrogenase
MAKKYNVGIIGYGWAASAHIAAINATQQAQVAAVCSSRQLDPAELSARHSSQIKVYNDLETMLSDPGLSVVDITSYPNQHAAQFIAASNHGKHVILEKPMAIEWDDLLAMEEAARLNGTKSCICFECRYSSQVLATKSLLDSGLIGSLHYGEVDYYHGIGPWYGQYRWNTKREFGGSALLTAGAHALDALLLCMGSPVGEVTSYGTQSAHPSFAAYEYQSTCSSILRFSNGAVGKCAAVVDCFQPYYFHTHLIGSHGSILDDRFHSEKIAGLNRSQWSKLAMKMLDSGDVGDHPYQSQFQAFFDSLDAGVDMPLSSFYDGFATHRVIEAADRSVKERRPIRMSEIPQRR